MPAGICTVSMIESGSTLFSSESNVRVSSSAQLIAVNFHSLGAGSVSTIPLKVTLVLMRYSPLNKVSSVYHAMPLPDAIYVIQVSSLPPLSYTSLEYPVQSVPEGLTSSSSC